MLTQFWIHCSHNDSKVSRTWGSRAAPNHDAPYTMLYSWWGMRFWCWYAVPFSFSFKHSIVHFCQNVYLFSHLSIEHFPEALWNTWWFLDKLETCRNIFFLDRSVFLHGFLLLTPFGYISTLFWSCIHGRRLVESSAGLLRLPVGSSSLFSGLPVVLLVCSLQDAYSEVE